MNECYTGNFVAGKAAPGKTRKHTAVCTAYRQVTSMRYFSDDAYGATLLAGG